MALRDKIAAEARQYLQPGEVVQTSLGATSRSPYLGLISYWLIFFHDAQRAIVATDQRILVMRTSRWRWTKFKAVEQNLPRSLRLGEPSGLHWKTSVLGETLWIHKRFHKDIRAIDAADTAPLPSPIP